jgi:hypothetical protein
MNTSVQMNKQVLMLHCVLIVMQSFDVISNTIVYWKIKTNIKVIIGMITTLCLMDFLVQIAICYICWTMGSSAQLRKFEVVFIKNQKGWTEVKFKQRLSEKIEFVE